MIDAKQIVSIRVGDKWVWSIKDPQFEDWPFYRLAPSEIPEPALSYTGEGKYTVGYRMRTVVPASAITALEVREED